MPNEIKNKKIKVVELFAGVGGFRLGLEGWKNKSATSGYKEKFESPYEIVWSNQWEPSTKMQHASIVYENRWGKVGHTNEDISAVDINKIPKHEMLVGGFPCQDYSVATTLKNSKGLIGKKGVLWWSIHRILSEVKQKPQFLILENVDRLLKSPASQRGRDFAIILKSLDELGYLVEWRVVNAAEYGFPQRRRRVFIIAYHKTAQIFDAIRTTSAEDWILKHGTMAKAFPVDSDNLLFYNNAKLSSDIVEISNNFNIEGNASPFENSGILINGLITTIKTSPIYEGKYTLLKDIIQNGEVSEEFYVKSKDLEKWAYLKNSKKEVRKNADGFKYNYSEGGMIFPDSLDKSSRTIITGEGGPSPSRFKHVINVSNRLRRLSPVELERLNMFPDNHTKLETITDSKRAFFMGNALVVGVVEKIGVALNDRLNRRVAI